jgi:hypothetical protein
MSTVTVSYPSVATGKIRIVQGDDYSGSRAITITGTTANQWPNLTSATITFNAWRKTGVTTEKFTKAGSVVTPTGTQVVSVSLADTDTSSKTPDWYDATFVATLSGGDIVTLWQGKLELLERYPA